MLLQYEQNQDISVLQDQSATSKGIQIISIQGQKNIPDSVQEWMKTLKSPIPASERPTMQEIVDIVRVVRVSGHE